MRSLFLVLVLLSGVAQAQIDQKDITRVLSTLAADSMMGRMPGTPYADKAAAFIASEFGKAGLKIFDGNKGFLQSFSMVRSATDTVTATADGVPVPKDRVLVFADEDRLYWKTGDAERIWIGKNERFGQRVLELAGGTGNKIVFADTSFRSTLARFRNFPMQRMKGNGSVVVVLVPAEPASFVVEAGSKITATDYHNVVGYIPGRRKEEFVIFSAHYDHLGASKRNTSASIQPSGADTIFNGANDDASGTTAVIALAKHFARMKMMPERSILFVAFTAEESGGYGSSYFSKKLDPAKIMAMFNIEMIGTDSKWGKNSAFITGYEKSDFGKLLQENLKGSAFMFHPDPYPQQNLFYRSDNATLARLGVPAHTISTSKMDSEPYYHTVDDEIETLDMVNMTEIIKAIALSSKGIIDGKQTPTRVVEKQ